MYLLSGIQEVGKQDFWVISWFSGFVSSPSSAGRSALVLNYRTIGAGQNSQPQEKVLLSGNHRSFEFTSN